MIGLLWLPFRHLAKVTFVVTYSKRHNKATMQLNQILSYRPKRPSTSAINYHLTVQRDRNSGEEVRRDRRR